MQTLFDILGLQPAFSLDMKTLETAYFNAQRICHPDRFVGKPEAERIAAISRSQLVNDAYETLKNPLRRAEHLLEMQGIVALDDAMKAPPQLLMEMMELRESLEEAGNNGVHLAAALDDIKMRANITMKALEVQFSVADYAAAANETLRLHYLGKAAEEAHMLIYRLKSAHAHV